MKNTWKTTHSEIKYQNPWITVSESDVIDDLGNEKVYGVVTIGEGSCVLPIDDNGNVYLAKQ